MIDGQRGTMRTFVLPSPNTLCPGCECDCVDGPEYSCGENSYNCLDPSSACFLGTFQNGELCCGVTKLDSPSLSKLMAENVFVLVAPGHRTPRAAVFVLSPAPCVTVGPWCKPCLSCRQATQISLLRATVLQTNAICDRLTVPGRTLEHPSLKWCSWLFYCFLLTRAICTCPFSCHWRLLQERPQDQPRDQPQVMECGRWTT